MGRIEELRARRAEVERRIGETIVPCNFPPGASPTQETEELARIDAELEALEALNNG